MQYGLWGISLPGVLREREGEEVCIHRGDASRSSEADPGHARPVEHARVAQRERQRECGEGLVVEEEVQPCAPFHRRVRDAHVVRRAVEQRAAARFPARRGEGFVAGSETVPGSCAEP